MVKRTNPDGFKEIAARLGEAEAQVGFFESARYQDGTPVAYIAAIQEFGFPAGGIAMRSFMRSTISDQKKNWRTILRAGSTRVIKGELTLFDVMDGVGLQAAGDMRRKISEISSPPLKESTIKNRQRRGNSSVKVLVDERIMINSLTNATVTK